MPAAARLFNHHKASFFFCVPVVPQTTYNYNIIFISMENDARISRIRRTALDIMPGPTYQHINYEFNNSVLYAGM